MSCRNMPARKEAKLAPVTVKLNELAGKMFEGYDGLLAVVCYIKGYELTCTRDMWIKQQEKS